MTISQTQSGTVKFGVRQLSNPTPKWVKYIQRGVLYISAVWAFLAPTLTDIPPNILADMNMWLLRGNGILSLTTKFFGWEEASNYGNFNTDKTDNQN